MPTVCVLWFMGEAMYNERLAARQKVADAYQAPLRSLEARLQGLWQAKLQVLGDGAATPAVVFDRIARTGAFDGVVVLGANGTVAYPIQASTAGDGGVQQDESWQNAVRLEHEDALPEEALLIYDRIAVSTPDDALRARALLGKARCLLRTGHHDEAIKILVETLAEARFSAATDEQGRLLFPAAMLLAMEVIPDRGSPDLQRVLEALIRRMNSYAAPPMPLAQRLFIIGQLADRWGVTAEQWPTLNVERVTCAYLMEPQPAPTPGRLARTAAPDLWQLASQDGRVIGFLRTSRVASECAAVIAREGISEATIRLVPPGESVSPDALTTTPAGLVMPGWSLTMSLKGADPLGTESQRRVTRYMWAGLLVSLLTVVLAGMLAGYVGRQVRLTRLKNDLIATVSHELKTPLASIRALVDTLLAGGTPPQQAREYLELIARENLRLSRLIDNFLTFSRMERNKHAFEFVAADPAAIATGAVDAVRERFESAGCDLKVEIASGLPPIIADRDAMVVVLLNLLDNAYKYTDRDKRISLDVRARDSSVCFAVRDNGIGLSRRSARRVFKQFYQVDQTLSRKTGGCGLGLSIVKFIVDAHGGTIDIDSQPGRGSTFTVRIPTHGGPGGREA